jgi:hypothetical protein
LLGCSALGGTVMTPPALRSQYCYEMNCSVEIEPNRTSLNCSSDASVACQSVSQVAIHLGLVIDLSLLGIAIRVPYVLYCMPHRNKIVTAVVTVLTFCDNYQSQLASNAGRQCR